MRLRGVFLGGAKVLGRPRPPSPPSCSWCKMEPVGDVAQVLDRVEQGDPKAAEELLPLVYEELRKLAAARMAQEKPGQTLQATALVHEHRANPINTLVLQTVPPFLTAEPFFKGDQ